MSGLKQFVPDNVDPDGQVYTELAAIAETQFDPESVPVEHEYETVAGTASICVVVEVVIVVVVLVVVVVVTGAVVTVVPPPVVVVEDLLQVEPERLYPVGQVYMNVARNGAGVEQEDV